MYKKFFIIKLLFIVYLALCQPLYLFAATVTTTDTVSISARVGEEIILGPTDSGGGVPTSVIFYGQAYPKATVFISKNGVAQSEVVADTSGKFIIRLDETYNPNVLYTLYAVDLNGVRSLLLNYPVVVKSGYLTQINGIRFAPTIVTDKTEVKYGDYLTVTGYALPSESMTVVIKGKDSKTFYLTSKSDGTYKMIIPLLDMPKGDYTVSVNYTNDKKISKVIQFTIGDVNILSTELSPNIPGDCNADQVITIVDFSVAAFWYSKPNPPSCIDTNNDDVIDLVDFSILAFYWTG